MSAVLLAFGSMLAAFVVHLVAWRIRVPRRAVRTLIAIFATALVAALGTGWTSVSGFGWGESLYLAALCGAIALSYLLVYTGIECDSPTLSLAFWAGQGGAAGRPAAELDAFVRACPFVQSRLAELEQGGFVIRRGENLEIVEKSMLVFAAGEFYRRLMGRTTRGG